MMIYANSRFCFARPPAHAIAMRWCINTNGGTYDITRAIIESAEEERGPVILGVRNEPDLPRV
jgi:hypothetical protein